MTKLVLATNNKNKIKEIREILAGTEWEVVSLADMNIDCEVVEDAETFEGNAVKKATEIMKITGLTTIADDSGICVEALNGAPGVYSARYALDRVKEGQDINRANNEKLIREMSGIFDRRAKYVCAMAIVFPDGATHVITDECPGEIARSEMGTGGFGYDPLFWLPDYGSTMAELSSEAKHRISHRGKAVRRLAKYLSER